MSKVWFISDLHFCHENLLKMRTHFQNIKDHDETIVNNILSVVNKRDTLWLLGDCFIYNDSAQYLKSIASHVNKVHLILGNHDFERSSSKYLEREIMKLIETGKLKIHGFHKYKHCWLSHAPIHHRAFGVRALFNIHGHTHATNVNDHRYINVSCEAINYKPLEFQTILKIIRERESVETAQKLEIIDEHNLNKVNDNAEETQINQN